MSNDLSGAIKRALYIADLQDQLAAICVEGKARDDCLKRAGEQRQLAAWLEELGQRRRQPEIIHCGECELNIECCRNIRSGGRKDDDFCSCGRRAERRTDA